MPRSLLLISFFSFSVHVASRCWIYPASSIGRRFGRETKLSKVDMINCFYFVSFVYSLPLFFFFLFFLYLAHSYSRSAAVMVGYSDFLDGFLCLQLVSMILLPATLDGLLCSSMITGSVHDTSLHFFFTSMNFWILGLGSVEISFRDDEARKN